MPKNAMLRMDVGQLSARQAEAQVLVEGWEVLCIVRVLEQRGFADLRTHWMRAW